jgi:hypothetical protein
MTGGEPGSDISRWTSTKLRLRDAIIGVLNSNHVESPNSECASLPEHDNNVVPSKVFE